MIYCISTDTDIILFDANSIIISLLTLSQLWPLGAPLRCLLFSLTCSHLIFSIFLLSVLTISSRIILGLPCSFFKICHFSRSSLHWRTVFRHQYWAIIATRPSQQTELEKNISIQTHIYLYFCIYVFEYIFPWAYTDTSESNAKPQGAFLIYNSFPTVRNSALITYNLTTY